MLESCLQVDPKKRLNAEQLLKCKFVEKKRKKSYDSNDSLKEQEDLLEEIRNL